MNRKWTGIRIVFGVCATIGWWGLLYPELTMTPDTYEVVWEDETVQPEDDMIEWDSEGDIYRAILEADESQIRYKSRFLMQLEAMFKKLK